MKKLQLPKSRRARVILAVKLALLAFSTGFWMAVFVDFDVMFNNAPVSLWIHCPTVVHEGESFTVTVEAWDRYERISGGYKGSVGFRLESYDPASNFSTIAVPVSWTIEGNNSRFTSNFGGMGIVPAYLVPGADNGKKAFSTAIMSKGLHYLVGTDFDTGRIYRSNPVLVVPGNDTGNRVFWGDIHFHSYYSDGSGSPAEVYQYARDAALLDFAALTDHGEMFPRFGDLDLFDQFKRYKATTNNFNDNGRFATIVALEWTPLLDVARSYIASGHVNYYFRGDDMPFFSTFDQFTPDEVNEHIWKNTNGKFLAWTHHTLREEYASDFAFHNDSINTMIEVYSCHGSSEFNNELKLYHIVHEFPPTAHGYSINDAFRMGRRYGIMASSDTHDGHPGHDLLHTNARALNQHPVTFSAYRYGVVYPGGLIAVRSSALNRTAVFDALANRAAYATTWISRFYLDFKVNGVGVGVNESTAVVVNTTSPRTLELTVAADGLATAPNMTVKIDDVVIFKNSEAWVNLTSLNLTAATFHFTDNTIITGTSYEHCIQRADGNWYIHDRSLKSVDPGTLNTGGADYYYARVTDTNGQAGWIGPIWVQPA